MTRKFSGSKLVIATHNAGKLAEIAALMTPRGIAAVSAGSLGLPEPEETGTTFEANATLKAVAAAQHSGSIALADDSGLSVTGLNGDPGVYSARWAPAGDFQAAMTLVQKKLGATTDRSAAFICTLALAWPDGHVETVAARCDGEIVWPPQGSGGFGYDPIFQANGESRTFGQMTSAEKRQYSHRAKAFALITDKCF